MEFTMESKETERALAVATTLGVEAPLGTVAEDAKKDMRAYSSQYTPGMGPGMIVGLHQTWPLLAPSPYYTTVPNYAPCLSISPFFMPKSCNFSLTGHSFDSFTDLVQDFGDKWTGNSAQAAATLANQLYCDNNELLYVLITDASSYPITSKPELWQFTEEQQNQVRFTLPNNGSSGNGKTDALENEMTGGAITPASATPSATLSFNCLFSAAQDIFALFVFSPTDIVFTLETSTQQQQALTSLFFHGRSRVSMSASQNPRVITVHFLEKDEEAQ